MTLTVRSIQLATARHYSLTLAELVGPRRHQGVVKPRQLAMWLARRLTGCSFPELGRAFGGRDHTTVLYACRKLDRMIAEDTDLRDVAEQIIMAASAYHPLGRGSPPLTQLRDMLPDGELRRCRAMDAHPDPELVQCQQGNAQCRTQSQTSEDVNLLSLGTGSS